jgi:hypothetical protein
LHAVLRSVTYCCIIIPAIIPVSSLNSFSAFSRGSIACDMPSARKFDTNSLIEITVLFDHDHGCIIQKRNDDWWSHEYGHNNIHFVNDHLPEHMFLSHISNMDSYEESLGVAWNMVVHLT